MPQVDAYGHLDLKTLSGLPRRELRTQLRLIGVSREDVDNAFTIPVGFLHSYTQDSYTDFCTSYTQRRSSLLLLCRNCRNFVTSRGRSSCGRSQYPWSHDFGTCLCW